MIACPRRRLDIRRSILAPALVALGTLAPSIAPAASPTGTPAFPIERLLVAPNPFSPNGDGRLDTTTIEITLAEAVASARVELRPPGSPAVLRSFALSGAAGTARIGWNGEDFTGARLVDGVYDVVAIAARGLEADTIMTTVTIDTTPLAIFALTVSPNPVAPGIVGLDSTALTTRTGAPGFGDAASVSLKLLDSLDAPVVLPLRRVAGTSTIWAAKWGGGNGKTGAAQGPAKDGVYVATVTTSDPAGNEASATGWEVDLDTNEPVVEVLEPARRDSKVILDTVRGSAADRSGATVTARVDSADVTPVTSPLAGGGVLWAVAVPETLRREGSFEVAITARDLVGRSTTETEKISVDLTQPETPVPDPLASRVITAGVNLSGRASGADSVLIFVDDATPLSTGVPASGIFRRKITLSRGVNRITLQASDVAGNQSAVSVPITVEYVEVPGFGVPAPFRSRDHFEVNLPADARSVEIRILTLEGRLVRTLRTEVTGREYEIGWDLKDSDAREVRNGPYILVMTARMADGGTQTGRKGCVVDAD